MSFDWPAWPQNCEETERLLLEVARSGQWTISGPSTGEPAMERRFAGAFARFADVSFAVPVSHGSAALTVALEALGVGAGDEVVVPALGWVACCSAVVAVGADPVFVDVDEATLGMDADAARRAVTSRTRAMLVVHLLGAPADLDRLLEVAADYGLHLVEDASQAHGGKLAGRMLGTFGVIGAYSLQQGKLLTCGEGGVAVTSDASLNLRLQELRADGRGWRSTPVRGFPELQERDGAQGHNYAMSSFQAAAALAGLGKLDQQLARRRESAARLDAALSGTGLVEPVRVVGDDEEPVFWRYAFKIDRMRRPELALVEEDLSAKLNCDVYGLEPPTHRHPLYRPQRTRRRAEPSALATQHVRVPQAEAAFATIATLPHRLLLGEPSMMDEVAVAICESVSSVRHASRH